MARGTMHAKKENGANRGATFATQKLTDDGLTRGPSLEDATGRTWDDDVLRWYDVWRKSPQAQLFTSTDWQRLALLAPLVESHFAAPKAATMSEIRLNEERLGATVTDRMRARITVTPAEDADVVSLSAVPDPAEDNDDDVFGLLT